MKRYCPSCSNTSCFGGEVCGPCERVERNCQSERARRYVAGYMVDYLRIPALMLKRMQDAV